ncbi:transglycosylase domain-containing protein [Erythrobacter litoralis]|uniref:Penicillin-binding protein, 1A family protein n=1 Tax=Erythrobacter litoralis (strain HTCC2594) TaxID=314225 RepID=Q2NCG4_ERYLH|nr:transglycosylase domain-containing protein [Erythrobacter litoralis]ABC62627.1 penicillin-binding protein, 1A family protein [Erythrobacter litoralis HTCC2594]
MNSPWFRKLTPWRRDPGRPQGAYAGYFSRADQEPLYRSGSPQPDFDRWDNRLDRLDGAVEREERRKQRWWQPAYWRERRKRWWIVRFFAAALMAFLALIAFLALTTPLDKSLEPVVPPQMTLLAADGTPIARNGAIVGEPVSVETLPPHVVEAFLAIEDRRFYDHWGVDPRGIARAAWTGVGGGSTITQQLAKFTFLSPERTLTRKAREALIAFWLETWLTKDEILERYLSNTYFGDNVYGLRAASLHYFYRQPEKLTLEQAAMLAGLVKAPSALRPTKHYARAEERMKLVVASMVAAGYLTEAEAARVSAPKLDVRTRSDLPTGTYFADWALPMLRRDAETGYEAQTITTTLDARLQGIASRIVQRANLGGAQAALVAMRSNGEVVAMVGGKDYQESPFNRVTQAKRQPGSTFKTFVWLAALEAGADPTDPVDNTEITQGSYRPRNYGERYSGSLTLEQAFARSSNVAAVRLYNSVGDEAVIRTARRLGVTSPLPPGDPSMALGTSTMTLLELTAAYAGIAANAYPVRPTPLPVQEQGWWEWLWDGPESFSGRVHDDMQQMLRAAVNSGTGRAAMLAGPNYGKTGTSQDNRDALFVGYAGDLVVGVWIGNDDNSPLNGVTGGGLPARMWRDFMRQAQGASSAGDTPRANPSGPVQPMDVPELEDVPLGEGVRLEDGGLNIETEIEGIPVDIRVTPDGVEMAPGSEPDG